jgi:hypothetical protein
LWCHAHTKASSLDRLHANALRTNEPALNENRALMPRVFGSANCSYRIVQEYGIYGKKRETVAAKKKEKRLQVISTNGK